MRTKIPQLVEALEGYVSEHHRFLIRMHLEHLNYPEQTIAQRQLRINEKMKPYQHQGDIICTTPGFDITSAQHTFVETGGEWSEPLKKIPNRLEIHGVIVFPDRPTRGIF